MTPPSSNRSSGAACPTSGLSRSGWRGWRCRPGYAGSWPPARNWACCARRSGPSRGSWSPGFGCPAMPRATRRARSGRTTRCAAARPTWWWGGRSPRPAIRWQRIGVWPKRSARGYQSAHEAHPMHHRCAARDGAARRGAGHAPRGRRARQAAGPAHDPQALVGQSASIVLQIPGADPSSPLGRAQAVELLRRYLRPVEERGLDVTVIREVEPGRGFVELTRRYVVAGTTELRHETLFLGFRLQGARWALTELRSAP